jgi:hypothetical protein
MAIMSNTLNNFLIFSSELKIENEMGNNNIETENFINNLKELIYESDKINTRNNK